MDWTAFGVGALGFLGVIISLIANYLMYKVTSKNEKDNIDDKYSREIITNSRKEWLKDMKNTLSQFFAYVTNIGCIEYKKDSNKIIEISELYHKLIFNFNPIGKIDSDLRNYLIEYYNIYENTLIVNNDVAIKKLKEETKRVEREFSYYFKAEWKRIQDYAKHGENSNFKFEEEFIKIRIIGEEQLAKDKKEGRK